MSKLVEALKWRSLGNKLSVGSTGTRFWRTGRRMMI